MCFRLRKAGLMWFRFSLDVYKINFFFCIIEIKESLRDAFKTLKFSQKIKLEMISLLNHNIHYISQSQSTIKFKYLLTLQSITDSFETPCLLVFLSFNLKSRRKEVKTNNDQLLLLIFDKGDKRSQTSTWNCSP